MFLCGAAAVGVMPAAGANGQETHRFRTADFDIDLSLEYHDGYSSRRFWFRQGNAGRKFCLPAGGEEGRQCFAEFSGSLAIAQYRVRPRSRGRAAPAMRERVRTLDRDGRLPDRPPFERRIELLSGVGSDLQAFGYEARAGEEESTRRLHSPWYLFRQDLFLEAQQKPFLVIFWKHALPSVRALDIILGEHTWPASK